MVEIWQLMMAERTMRARAQKARVMASRAEDDSQHAAALRGKAKGYDEAATVLLNLAAKVTPPEPRGQHVSNESDEAEGVGA